MAADPSPSSTAKSAARVASPPWQVRWKRPQWDRVVVGIDDDDFTDDGRNNDHEIQSHSNDGNGLEHEFEDENDLQLQQPGIDKHWQPVSCSSVVLTREEARMAILELSKRGKLLVRRRKERKGSKQNTSNNSNEADANAGNSSKAKDDVDNLNTKAHDPSFEYPGSPSGHPTPRNKNTKHIDTTQIGEIEGTKIKYGKINSDNQTKDNFFTPATPTNAQGSTSNSKKKKSFTSPSTWLFGGSGDKDYVDDDRGNTTPPRSSQSRKNLSADNTYNGGASAKKSPSSPTSFSTFANFVAPNFGSKSKNRDKVTDSNDGIRAAEGLNPYEDDEIGNNSHTHSPPNIDASTASSLLWEDMTLTSVSEEDAAAFRMKKGGGGVGGSRGFGGASSRLGGGSFGRKYYNPSGRDNIDDDVEHTSSSRINRVGSLDGVRLRFEDSSQINDGGGKFYCDSRGNLRLSDWDGFDNVVLTVTIFATKPDPSSGLSEGKQSNQSTVKKQRKSYPPTSGDVVVMELLSTKNPPTSESSMIPATNQSNQNRSHSRGDIAAAAAAAAKWGKTDKNPNPPQINISSSSSSSSIPNSSKNPPLQSMGLHNSCGYTSGTSGTEDDSTSPHQHHPRQQLEYENSLITEEEEKEIPSNHTRILARRVLRWPTSVLSRHGIANEKENFYRDRPDFPMFVSLGRTNKWKKHKQDGNSDHDDREHGSNIPLRKQVPRGGSSVRNREFGGPNNDRGNGSPDDGEDDGLLESEQYQHIDEDDDNHEGMGQDESDDEKMRSKKAKSIQQSNSHSWLDQFFDQGERVADAVEAIQSLNFLFGGDADLFDVRKSAENNSKVSSGTSSEAGTGKKATKRNKFSQPLSLCFVTRDGCVHFFHALSVFLSRKHHDVIRGRSGDAFIDSFASFLMGHELFASVCEDVAPLSKPKATLRLTQLPKAVLSRHPDGDDIGIDPASWDNIVSRDKRSLEYTNQFPRDGIDVHENNNWSQLSNFDASIDSSTLIYCTLPRSNVITGACITSDVSNSHLVVCGKGLRRIAQNDKRVCKCYVLGGFVTFVSLRHYSESRTIYLPFSPQSAHPVYWDGMHFIILLGEEGTPVSRNKSKIVSSWDSSGASIRWGDAGTNQDFIHQSEDTTRYRRPYAVAVRVDSKIDVGDKVLLTQPLSFPLDGRDKEVQFAIKDSLLSSSARFSFNSSAIGNSIRSNESKRFEPNDSIFMPKVQTWQEDSSDSYCEHSSDLYSQNNSDAFYPRRFQSVQILFPSVDDALGHTLPLFTQGHDQSRINLISPSLLSVSAVPSSPPGIVSTYQFEDQESNSRFVVVVNHTLDSFLGDGTEQTTSKVLSSTVRVGHRVLLSLEKKNEHDDTVEDHEDLYSVLEISPSPRNLWCTGGQGWSIIGSKKPGFLYFISWDGATDAEGPFLFELNLPVSRSKCHSPVFITASGTIPLMNYIAYTEDFLRTFMSEDDRSKGVELPFSKPYGISSFPQDDNDEGIAGDLGMKLACSSTLKESIKAAIEIEGGIDDVILTALQSISSPSTQPEKNMDNATIQRERPNRSKMLAMSHAEKSRRLLRHCSSWTQLDDKRANRGIVTGQVIMATVRFGTSQSCLTLRTNVVTNPNATPYHQVLAWLCQRKDYFTAASIALSLLQDFDAVYELRGIPKTSDGEVISHQGLLDGITPLINDDIKGGKFSGPQLHTLTSLADMTVGCLIKGGTVMAPTLDGFLARNPFYEAPRACLMLVGTVAAVISQESPNVANHHNNNNIVKMLSTLKSPRDDVLWPVRCLLKMAVTRKCLPSVLLMLNATIPNELRWRSPKTRGLAESPRPSLSLCLAIVEMILESANEATRYFLNLSDEDSCLPYWFSIDDQTRLVLSILSIHGKFVMLQEPEVRSWALAKLKDEIHSSVDFNDVQSDLPSEWLKEIVTGVFCNAGCDIGLGFDSSVLQKSEDFESTRDEYNSCYRQDMLRIENLLNPQRNSGGLDFDVLIAALLILVQRDENWRDGTSIPTQILLNVVCDKAGRKTEIDQKFIFDGATTMRLCALSENYQATAFLIGGKKGIILECADIIITNLGLSIKEAELLLFAGSIHEMKDFVTRIYRKVQIEKKRLVEFFPSESQQHLLWLLEQYSMNVRKYGEFNAATSSIRVNPVFAGRVCFRAWICLTQPSNKESSAKWLEKWLRNKLGLNNGVSSKRLACAALVRILLWADEASGLELTDGDEEPLLAVLLGLNGKFIAELAHACCGMLESIPSHLADEIMSGLGGSNLFFFETELLNA